MGSDTSIFSLTVTVITTHTSYTLSFTSSQKSKLSSLSATLTSVETTLSSRITELQLIAGYKTSSTMSTSNLAFDKTIPSVSKTTTQTTTTTKKAGAAAGAVTTTTTTTKKGATDATTTTKKVDSTRKVIHGILFLVGQLTTILLALFFICQKTSQISS